MARAVKELMDDAMTLPIEERSRLAESLLDSVRTPEEVAIAAEWEKVAQQRVEEIERAEVELIDEEDVLARLRAALADARQIPSRR